MFGGDEMGIALVVLIFSIIAIFSPRTPWYLSTGWKFKEAEPSDFALGMNRFLGVIAAIVSVIIILSSIISSMIINNWPNEFVDRLNSDNVLSIVLERNFDETLRLQSSKIENALQIIKNVNMKKGDSRNTFWFTSSGTIEIKFRNYDKVKIYNSSGNEFYIEQYDLDIEYMFESEELKKWFSKQFE